MGRKPVANDTLRGLTVTSKALQELVGVTKQSISTWVREGMPKAGRDAYPATECLRWIVARANAARPSDADQALVEARRRLVLERVRGHELENNQMEGELLPPELVHADLQAFAGIVADELERVAREAAVPAARAASELEATVAVRAVCNAARRRIAERVQAYGEGLAGGADD